jgi:hypothetical protein
MNPVENAFPPVAFVKARLFREAVYREDREDWLTLRGHLEEVRRYFREIGQELVFDEAEGYAFIRQLEPEGEERVPRLTQRRPLSYVATLLLVMLREELLRFDAAPGDSLRLVKTRDELRNLIADFFPDSTNQVRDTSRFDTAIRTLIDLGFLRALNAGGDQEAFEVMRIIKARLSPADLETIKERLRRHAQP